MDAALCTATPLTSGLEEMPEIVERLVRVYDPLRIYLFGSYAWGTPDKFSDYDIYVVVEENQKEQTSNLAVKGYDALRGIRKSVDILVSTLPEFEKKSAHPSTMTYPIRNKGIVLYEHQYEEAVSRLQPEDLAMMREFYEAWLYKAEHDFETAQITFRNVPPILDASVFHAQQCAEKALKAFLSFSRQPIERTHKLEDLIRQCAGVDSSFGDLLEDAKLLTPSVSEFRYPEKFTGDDDLSKLDPTPADTQKAIAAAAKFLDFVQHKIV
jgi:HEPN domain-containing protein/predicted nucleotidyltransferase